MSGLALDPSDGEPCVGCGRASIVTLGGTEGEAVSRSCTEECGRLALCPECAIKAEAMLRGVRKHGPRVANWSGR